MKLSKIWVATPARLVTFSFAMQENIQLLIPELNPTSSILYPLKSYSDKIGYMSAGFLRSNFKGRIGEQINIYLKMVNEKPEVNHLFLLLNVRGSKTNIENTTHQTTRTSSNEKK